MQVDDPKSLDALRLLHSAGMIGGTTLSLLFQGQVELELSFDRSERRDKILIIIPATDTCMAACWTPNHSIIIAIRMQIEIALAVRNNVTGLEPCSCNCKCESLNHSVNVFCSYYPVYCNKIETL